MAKIKLSKVERSDIDALWKIIYILESLNENDTLPSDDESEQEEFDGRISYFCEDIEDDKKDIAFVKKALAMLLSQERIANLARAVMTLETLVSSENALIDPDADTLEFHPRIKAMEYDKERLDFLEKKAENEINLFTNIHRDKFLQYQNSDNRIQVIQGLATFRETIDQAMQQEQNNHDRANN